LPNSMYYNSYQYTEDYVLMGLQHAVLETAGWYNDSMRFFDGGGGWFMRGFGISLVEDFPIITGIFSVGDGDAGPNMFGTFRPVLVK